MNWRDFIVTSKPEAKSRKDFVDSVDIVDGRDTQHPGSNINSVDSVDFVTREEKKKSSSYMGTESPISTPRKISTIHTKPPKADGPHSPLQCGWRITYRDQHGRLRGGWDERDAGTVQSCQWDGQTWQVTVPNGDVVPLRWITAVAKLDAEGHVLAAWTVRDCGYDGEGAKG